MILLLVRHGMADTVGRIIAGRTPGVHLNEEGAAQAAGLASCLASLPIAAVYSSPLERAMETAAPIARELGLASRSADGLLELDFGEWTGKSLEALDADPRWRAFNTERGRTRIPGGETMDEVIRRAQAAVEEIRQAVTGAMAVAVSHGDVIRGLLVTWLGIPLNDLLRLEVDAGSVSTVALSDRWPPRVLGVNWRPGRPV